MYAAAGTVRRMILQQKAWIKQQKVILDSDATIPLDSDDTDSFLALVKDATPALHRENAIYRETELSNIERGSAPVFEEGSVVSIGSALSVNPGSSVSQQVYGWVPLPNVSPASSPPCTSDASIGSLSVSPDSSVSQRCAESYPLPNVLPAKSNPCRGNLFTMPKFSKVVKDALDSGHLGSKFDQVVKECAYHVFACGDMKDKGSYLLFGKWICDMYPCLRYYESGKSPWTHFNQKLSQTMRNSRYLSKHQKGRKSTLCSVSNTSGLNVEESYAALRDEYAKPNPCWSSVVELFKFVHFDRRKKLSDMRSTSVSDILEAFPLLKNMKLVREEFWMLVSRNISGMKQHYNNMLKALKTVFIENQQIDEVELDEVSILLRLQAILADARVRTKSSFQTITVGQVHGIMEYMESPKLDSTTVTSQDQ